MAEFSEEFMSFDPDTFDDVERAYEIKRLGEQGREDLFMPALLQLFALYKFYGEQYQEEASQAMYDRRRALTSAMVRLAAGATLTAYGVTNKSSPVESLMCTVTGLVASVGGVRDGISTLRQDAPQPDFVLYIEQKINELMSNGFTDQPDR